MIKTLRKRFIRIAMLAVTAVLLALCLGYTINIQHLLSLVKLLNTRRIHRNVRL